MELIDVTPEIRRLFLEQVADEYKIFGKERILFLCRFDYPNKKCKDTEIFEQLKIDKSLVSTPRKNLTSIYNKLGFPRTKNGRGASPKGESPFNKASDWLWIEKFNEWLKLQQNPNVQMPILNDDEWLKVCHTKLEDQQQEIRNKALAIRFELDFPPVPLGLEERKHKEKQQPIGDDNQEKKPKIYEHNDFLEQVINQNSAEKNKHIAIVGEPGAGKTTLLSAIASYIKNENKELPIFISLGDLKYIKSEEYMTLEEYILNEWLPHALRLVNPDSNPTSEIKEQLKSRFHKGGVWLLLDGVDEMGKFSPIQALDKISRERKNWLGQARVVLTCRLNVWDANPLNNDLSGFDTYKPPEFNPEQVDEFIEKWFKCDDKIQGGEELKAKLREPGKERICELVTNPLRLSLLCHIFDKDKHGELPETKAGLFDLYANNFYGWKPQFITQSLNYTSKQELHQALGRLALAGIDSNARFRLKESFAVQNMGQYLFDLACNVGWLTVDRDARTNEAVYAFWHRNFQEYFAALAIYYYHDWHYFLNHVPNNPENGIYRIFEPQWKEVILLWMGRQDILPNIKDEFMNELSNFEDGCDFSYDCPNIWKYNLFPIAKECLQEFTNCQLNNVIFEDEDEVVTEFDHVWQSDLYDWILRHNLDCMRSSSQREEIIKSLINKLGIWMHYSAEEDDDFGFHTFMVMYDEYEKSKENIKQREIEFQEEVKWINTAKVPAIVNKLSSNNDQFIRGAIINRLIQIFSEDNTEIANISRQINYHLNDDFNDDFIESLIYILHQSGYYDHLEIVKMCMQILKKSRNKTTIIAALDYLYDISCDQTAQSNVTKEIVLSLNKNYFQFLFKNNCKDLYWYCYEILLNCSSSMTYPEFYHAWLPLQKLENQFTDTNSHLSQLQPTEKTYPLTLNLKTLQDETDISAIAQKICNQIYTRFFHENLEIPQVNNAPQLERIILQVRNYLKKENIALIINNCEPNQEMIKFCNKLTDVLHIAFITEQPLDAPLKGFPNQPNLLNAIQHWINEIG